MAPAPKPVAGYYLSPQTYTQVQRVIAERGGESGGGAGSGGAGRQVIHVTVTSAVPDSFGYFACQPTVFNGTTWDVFTDANAVAFQPNGIPLLNGGRYLAVRYGNRSDGKIIFCTENGSNSASVYVKITAHTSGKYAFSEYAPSAGGTPTLVTGGLTGTVSAGYLQDIQGFADSGLINKFCQILPNPSLPGCWIMGPWVKKILTDTVAGAITISSTCNPETGSITNVVSQADPTVTSTTIYYIGG